MIQSLARRDDLLLLADPQAGPGAILYSDDSDAEPRVVNAETAWGLSYWRPTTEPLPALPPAIVQELADYNASHASDPALDEIRSMAADDAVRAAAGHDVTPGHDELHHYWVEGKGRHLWADSPTPWRTLFALVTKELEEHSRVVSPEVVKNWVSRWFIEVKGYAAGSDKNRVAHGQPPRGHRIGPG